MAQTQPTSVEKAVKESHYKEKDRYPSFKKKKKEARLDSTSQ
jgi:hypothetical protein